MAAPSTTSFAEGLGKLIQQTAGLMVMPDADQKFLQALIEAMVQRAQAPAGQPAAAGAPGGAPPPGAGPAPGAGGMPMSPQGGPAGPPAGVRPMYPMGNPDEIRRMVGAAQQ